jgi:hypothetical protein
MKSRVTCRGPGRDLKGRSEYLRLGIFPLVGMRRRSAWTFFFYFSVIFWCGVIPATEELQRASSVDK